MTEPQMPSAAGLPQPDATKDAMRAQLSKIEDAVLKSFGEVFENGGDSRWLAIARTHIEQGFMAAKRSLYEGKRVGDP